MLPFILQGSQIAQLPIAQAGQLLLVTGVSFVIIVLIASTYRFHRMIQLGEDALSTPEACNDFFFIQVTRYLSKINRISPGFGILIIQFLAATTDRRRVQEELLDAVKKIIRNTTDKACLFRNDCTSVIIDAEETRVADTAQRIIDHLKKSDASIAGLEAFRIGVSIFPAHGLNTRALIDCATDALETVNFNATSPYCVASTEKSIPHEPESTPPVAGELSRQDKNTALDPLTGVLHPSVVGSYMRKYLADFRHNKQSAAVLCIGINHMDQIIELHGESSADDVIAGVSRVLQRLTRDSDLIGRYHRDDFLILAPCTLQQGERIATRLREAVQKEIFQSQKKRIKASVSIGITAFPEHGRNLRDLFRGAYQSLETVRGWNTSACLVYDPGKPNAEKP